MNERSKDLPKRYELTWYLPGMLLFVVGLVLWAVPQEGNEIPYKTLLTGTICLSFGAAFLGVIPLWKRIARLEQYVSDVGSDSRP